jgi:hypothetical protein
MTLTLDVPVELESGLREAAAREGMALDALALDALRERVTRNGQNTSGTNGSAPAQASPEIAARLAALHEMFAVIDAQPNHRAGLPELDLSGERADVYGYSEREDAQL